MKQIIALLLTLCLCVGLSACSNGSAPSPTVDNIQNSEKTEPISLSTSNWKQYLHIETEAKNYSCKETNALGLSYAKGTADCVISISKSVPCNFSNVCIQLEVYSYSIFWREQSETINIYVSADGYASKSISFTSERCAQGVLSEPKFSYKVVSITGTVEVES